MGVECNRASSSRLCCFGTTAWRGSPRWSSGPHGAGEGFINARGLHKRAPAQQVHGVVMRHPHGSTTPTRPEGMIARALTLSVTRGLVVRLFPCGILGVQSMSASAQFVLGSAPSEWSCFLVALGCLLLAY